jgi:hypothetical protein
MRLINLYVERSRLNLEIVKGFKKVFRIGTTVKFYKYGGEITATIIRHTDIEKVEVKNVKTGLAYWVPFYDILRHEINLMR